MSTVLSFESQVAPSYEWVPDNENPRLRPIAKEIAENLAKKRHYVFGLYPSAPWNPLGDATPDLILKPVSIDDLRTVWPTVEDPALFRNFASMEPTTEAIAAFAGRFGLLSGGLLSDGAPRFYEWEREIRQMRFLIEIWDAVTTKQTRFLRKHFNAVEDGVFRYPFPELLRQSSDSELCYSEPGNILQAASEYLAIALTAKCINVRPEIVINPRSNQWQIEMRLTSLDDALWMQFAESVAAHRAYRQCETCGQYMELSPELNRADRRYCSDACRSKALRSRQKLARQMRESGKMLREIAKATGSDMQTIKQWIHPKGK